MSAVDITRHDNGLLVLSEHMPHLESAALGVWVNAGARAEREHEHGIAHLLEHMAFKGTHRRTARDIAEAIENVGGDLNAATSFESTAYYARVLKDDVPLAVDILSDILTDSLFEPEELLREQDVITQEIMSAQDTPDDLVFDLAQSAAFPEQTLGRSILGTEATVRAFSPADLKDYLGRHYAPARMVVAAAGHVDHDRLNALVGDAFAHLPNASEPQPTPARFESGVVTAARPIEQSHLVLGFPSERIGSDAIYAVQVLSTILGGGMASRLFQEAREKRGLCYGIYAYSWSLSDTGFFGIYAATGPDLVEELTDVVRGELVAVAEKGVSDTELARAKAQLKAGLLMSLESPSSRIEQMARQIMAFGEVFEPTHLARRVDAVTVDDVQALAAKIFRAHAPAIAAVGPEAGMDALNRMNAAF